jgi:transposase-like protein
MSIATRHQPAPTLTLVPRPPSPRPRWTKADDALLIAAYGQHTAADLAAKLGRSVHGVRWRARTLGLATGQHPSHQARTQQEITRLRAENDHLKHGALDAAHAPMADARRLAVLMAYRLNVVDAATAAVVLGVPVGRLPVEVGKAAKLGLDVAREALGR